MTAILRRWRSIWVLWLRETATSIAARPMAPWLPDAPRPRPLRPTLEIYPGLIGGHAEARPIGEVPGGLPRWRPSPKMGYSASLRRSPDRRRLEQRSVRPHGVYRRDFQPAHSTMSLTRSPGFGLSPASRPLRMRKRSTGWSVGAIREASASTVSFGWTLTIFNRNGLMD